MIINPTEISAKDRYKLVIGTILPRPIAWVSTMSKAGELNLAPFSYFTVASTNPLTLLFCPQNSRDNLKKDTLRNVYEVPEFVINLTNEETAEAMNCTATTLPHGYSEFEYAGLTPVASQTISVPRVAEAPVAFECKLQQVVTVSETQGSREEEVANSPISEDEEGKTEDLCALRGGLQTTYCATYTCYIHVVVCY